MGENRRVKRIAVGVMGTALLWVVAGCGGGSSPSGPGALELAQQACNAHGQQAADLAAQAAKLDPKYQQLASDEQALASNLAAQQAGAAGGDTGDINGITGQSGTGSGSSYQVLLDCKNVSLSLLPGVG